MKPRILLALPMGSRQLDIGSAVGWLHPSRRPDLYDIEHSRTAGGYTFATLWAEALNKRKLGVTHFAMIHTDVDPALYWLDTLWEILNGPPRRRIASCVIAMKDMLDESSTGYAYREGRDRGVVKLPLSTTDALPPVFSIKDVMGEGYDKYHLCLNTGLWLADIRPLPDGTDWAKQIQWVGKGGFRENEKGDFEPWFESEDWLESRKLANLLSPEEIVAVGPKAIEIGHWGWFKIGNRSTRGVKCRTCHDLKVVDNGRDTVPCPDCSLPAPGMGPGVLNSRAL